MPAPAPPSTGALVVRAELPRPVDVALTLQPLQRGPYDPCHRRDGQAVWRTSRLASGPVTYRLVQDGPRGVRCHAWGAGAEELSAHLPALLGAEDDPTGFRPEHPSLAEAHRRLPALRIPRTGRVLEALVPAILEQRVHSVAAFASWRRLVTWFGDVAPGPAPEGMRVPPAAETWRRVPSWEFHRANVDPGRARTVVSCARLADRLERLVDLAPAEAQRKLRSIPGVGVWTAAEVAQRAFGDADALSVGDYHLATIVGWSLLGAPLDDAGMVKYLEPLRPHRYRAVRLIMATGGAGRVPRRGPRTPITDHRGR
ncbi:DNA-3-methyladenine glycosylase 2 family protein [Rhodococcus sp. DMU1]|uniref:DNA-3-methyladenine glycosylase family protein n=1 Tax=Rhodococcus sp. DMU1 TaxID=2722825 RepID=UPI00143EC5AA|nr:DNA-3-methyladenine glycosylase 2 family protein [Rhodococcus sp. DMU1]QIX52350.1 DNA-3-methyladenine glycosylase 2 family protein [Rhodococcus sp. DMU1]